MSVLSKGTEYPKMFRVRQKFDAPKVENVASAVPAELSKLQLGKKVQPGQSGFAVCPG